MATPVDNRRTTPTTNPFLVCVYGVCCLLVYFGNTLTITSIAKFEALRKPSSSFIISLSVADIVAGLVTPFYVSMNYIGIRHLSAEQEKVLCLFTLSMVTFSGSLSLYSLLAISVERFIAVFYPFKHAVWFSQTRVNVVIISMWTLFLSIALVPFFGIHKWKPDIECTYINVLNRSYMLFILGPCVIVGLCLSQFFYCCIFYRAYQQRKKIASIITQPCVSRVEKQREKHTKLMTIVLLVFLMCWTPYTLCSALIGSMKDSAPYPLIITMEVAKVVVFCNSFFNPLIYGWKSSEFRKAYWKLLGCQGRQCDASEY